MLSNRKGSRGGRLPSAGVKPGDAGWESDESALELGSKQKKSSSTVHTLLRHVYFFCAILNFGLPDFIEEDALFFCCCWMKGDLKTNLDRGHIPEAAVSNNLSSEDGS